MQFSWGNLSKSTQRELARAAGLKVTKAQAELTATFGETPTVEFVTAVWPVLRDGWVLREPQARSMMVEQLQAARLGNQATKTRSRSGQMEYLRSCRLSDTLKQIALDVLISIGSVPFDDATPPESSTAESTPSESMTAVSALQQACRSLEEAAMPTVELAACLAIHSQLKGITLPVSDERERRDLVESIVVAAILAFLERSKEIVPQEDSAPHRRWVFDAAQRIAEDAALAELVVDSYARGVDQILSGSTSGFRTAFRSLSMFFITIATHGRDDITAERSDTLFDGLVWLLGVIPEAGDEAGDAAAPDPAAPLQLSSTNTNSDSEAPSLEAFVDRCIRQIVPNSTGPGEVSLGVHGWSVPAGSAIVNVQTFVRPDEPPVLLFWARLLTGVQPSAELFDALNTINEREHFYKVYLRDGNVMLEYEQIADDLSLYRAGTSLRIFCDNADHPDNIFKDRFGGETMAAGVKARFSV